ncbi:MAG: glutamate--tRNA ligase [Verrucomicrobia bacterium]|nr:glutamate--tRNA ligase [Verrucomicrobiota bacterium]
MSTRVRFAPSPTGLLHVGGARTALFNWLYARHAKGVFVLRVEDTDEARNSQEAIDVIFSGLKWLGLDWDEGPQKGGDYGPYFQSQRKEIYLRYAQRLLDAKLAYDDKGAIRFKLPKKIVRVPDLICGAVHFDLSAEPDLTIVRPDGSFIFHLVNVVDDIEMKITHVIRGEDHLSNTPKHLALFEALGAAPPLYAHIPLILNRDGSKMSKRDEGAAVGDYAAKGFAPEAVRNYLCFLGWSPKDDREILLMDEVVALFELSNVHRHNARFDMDKLQWMNGQYLARMTLDRFVELGRPVLEKNGLVSAQTDPVYLRAALETVKEKVKLFTDLPIWMAYFFKDAFPMDADAAEKSLKKPGALDCLRDLRTRLERTSPWNAAQLEADLKSLAAEKKVKAGEFIHPCRVACSGRSIGPGLYQMLEVLGRARVLDRLDRASGATTGGMER